MLSLLVNLLFISVQCTDYNLPVDLKTIAFIDFNLAYNPYTEYSVKYNSIEVPETNKLPFKVLAGEKKYQ